MLQCSCKLVLLTRLREPFTWYRSFWDWSGVARKQQRNASEWGESLVEFATAYTPKRVDTAAALASGSPVHGHPCHTAVGQRASPPPRQWAQPLRSHTSASPPKVAPRLRICAPTRLQVPQLAVDDLHGQSEPWIGRAVPRSSREHWRPGQISLLRALGSGRAAQRHSNTSDTPARHDGGRLQRGDAWTHRGAACIFLVGRELQQSSILKVTPVPPQSVHRSCAWRCERSMWSG